MELSQAINFIQQNAEQHRDKRPTLGTLLEEVAELARALEGTHEHHAALELIQIGGIVANLLTRYSWTDANEAVQGRWPLLSTALLCVVGGVMWAVRL